MAEVAGKPIKQLGHLMYLQGGDCFFCGQPIPPGEASVEHLVAVANGGGNGDGNCVACCRTLNSLLGSRPLKDKLKVVLNQKGQFRCPMLACGNPTAPDTAVPAPPPLAAKVAMVMEDLRKRGKSRPLKLGTLHNTIVAAFQKQLSEGEVASVMEQLQANGSVSVSGQGGKLTYKLPKKKQ